MLIRNERRKEAVESGGKENHIATQRALLTDFYATQEAHSRTLGPERRKKTINGCLNGPNGWGI
jgi:hypothetical protein